MKAYLLEKEHPQLSSRIHGIWHHLLADWDQVLQEKIWNMEEGARQELQSSSISTPFKPGLCTPEPLEVLPHCGMMDYPRCISESWKVNFKSEVCSKPAFIRITVHCKEVATANSIDDLLTQRSVAGRRDFPDYNMLGAMIASALKKLLTRVHFRKRVSVEEQRDQTDDRFLRGRQIACMICEHFRATGANEAKLC